MSVPIHPPQTRIELTSSPGLPSVVIRANVYDNAELALSGQGFTLEPFEVCGAEDVHMHPQSATLASPHR